MTPLGYCESRVGGRKEHERVTKLENFLMRLEGIHWLEIAWLSIQTVDVSEEDN